MEARQRNLDSYIDVTAPVSLSIAGFKKASSFPLMYGRNQHSIVKIKKKNNNKKKQVSMNPTATRKGIFLTYLAHITCSYYLAHNT